MTAFFLNLPFQTTFSIKTDSADLVPALKQHYGKYITESPKNASFHIDAVHFNHSFAVTMDDLFYVSEFPLRVIDELVFKTTCYDKNILALHGAAVEQNGKAYLFLASTTSGKTTLASYLTENGFGYITDDCILIDKEHFHVYPYCTPIHLRNGGVEVLKKYGSLPDGIEFLDDALMQRYVYTPKNCITKGLELSHIFFIQRTESENSMIPMNATERMTELMKAPIKEYPITADYIKLISRLAKCSCSKLLYSDMRFVKEVIENG